ncbi:MAG: glycosyltransferase family 9 protein [Betaproteobacteria bacterium]
MTDAATPSSFLVIRRDNIGDLVCTTPLISALRSRYPDAWIGALVNRYAEPVLAGNPDLDAVFSYQKAKHRAPGESVLGLYAQRLRMLLGLRRRTIDTVILASPGYQASAERLARWVKPRHIIGFDNGSGLADKTVAAQTGGMLHQVENNFRLLQVLGIDGPPPALKLFPDPKLVEAYRRQLPATDGPVVGVHVSAREADRRWPDACFIELITALITQHHATVVLTWAPGRRDNPRFPGDDDSTREIATRCASDRLLVLPTVGLAQLIASLAVCDYVICSDGGPVHLAAALGKPVVSLFGSERPELWHPWGVPYRLLQPPSQSVSDVTVREVLAAGRELAKR